MRTTVLLDDELVRVAKQRALETGRTLTAVIEDALRVALAERPAQSLDQLLALPTFGAGGVRAGVDLDASASLLESMEDPAARH